MYLIDWAQILIFIIVIILVSPLLGKYLALALEGKWRVLTVSFGWLERGCYRLSKIDPNEEMNWKEYLKSLLFFNFLGFLFLLFILLTQNYLFLNPQEFPALPFDLAFNTAASFVTNTNWQAYSGETTMSYFSQMVGLTTQNFLSAATGLCVLLCLIRGFVRKTTEKIGNFWVDLVRAVVYVLLPMSFILAILLVSQGVVQTLKPYQQITTLEGHEQTIPLGPAASQVAIKQLGSNGGGFFGVNSAHPFENPTGFSNYLEHLAILLIPAGLVFTFGILVNQRSQGIVIFYVMICFWVAGIIFSGLAESKPNPALDIASNMEGIETRLEISNSFFWTMSTTNIANGSANTAISSLQPITEAFALFNMMIGEVIFGGVGVGMCTMLKFVILSVFIAGLMVGRTPEYLGKKIEKNEILWIMIAILTPAAAILIGSAMSYILPTATDSISAKGPHGFSEILYAFTSAAANNGSSLAGLSANTSFLNLILGIVMILTRLAIVVPSLAIAGSLARKKFVPPSQGTLQTDTFLFGVLLTGIILIIGALTFFPVLILGPILEHFLMLEGVTF